MNEKNIQKTAHTSNYNSLLLHPNAVDKSLPTNTPPSSIDETCPSQLLQPMCWFLLITIVSWLAIALPYNCYYPLHHT